MSSRGARSFRVGLFVVFGLLVGGFAIFLIGDSRHAFDTKVVFRAKYDDVVGLRPGAPVRMGGFDVGTVGTVKHADDVADTKIYVTVEISRNEAGRVRQATVAKVANKGLLGDKMMELSVAPPTSPTLAPNGEMQTEEPSDMGKLLADATDIAKKAKETMTSLQKATEQIADPAFQQDVKGTVRSLHQILDGVANGQGPAHKLIFDEEEGRRVDRILTSLDQSSANLAAVSANAREVTERAKTGPGFVHTLVYDDKMAGDVAGTLLEIHGALSALRTGNGLGHTFIYGDDASQHVMGNVSAMSDDLRTIVANVKAGKGTLGALLVDPSVYEDIKSLVGNVERNQVLRALVRYSIKENEEKKPHADVTKD